jgi:hypothetical protein
VSSSSSRSPTRPASVTAAHRRSCLRLRSAPHPAPVTTSGRACNDEFSDTPAVLRRRRVRFHTARVCPPSTGSAGLRRLRPRRSSRPRQWVLPRLSVSVGGQRPR